jgi:energy-coupling factor transporter ATP-binding protein EcfA2
VAPEDVLARRRVRDGVARPADGDAFWLLLAHCLLDRGTVAPHYRPRLHELAREGAGAELGPALLARAPTAPPALLAAVADDDWERVDALGARLTGELRRGRTSAERTRGLALELARAAAKPRLLARRHGPSLALLGPNGVGKSTLAEALRRDFPLDSRIIYMGLWKAGGPFAPIVRPARIWARYLLARYHQLRGRLVIFDRYVDEARLPARGALVGLKRPYFWLLAHSVPPAGATVVLDVPGNVAYARKQENPPDELERERRVYGALAGAQVVDASREPADVRADVEAILWRGLSQRWGPR